MKKATKIILLILLALVAMGSIGFSAWLVNYNKKRKYTIEKF